MKRDEMRDKLLEQAAQIGEDISRAYRPLIERAVQSGDRKRTAELEHQRQLAVEANTKHIATMLASLPQEGLTRQETK